MVVYALLRGSEYLSPTFPRGYLGVPSIDVELPKHKQPVCDNTTMGSLMKSLGTIRGVSRRAPVRSNNKRSIRSNHRYFTQLGGLRPQLPYLDQPARHRTNGILARYISTDTKRWIIGDVKLGVKITLYMWAGGVLLLIAALGLEQEKMERAFPSPPQYSWWSRYLYRSTRVKDTEEMREVGAVDFALTSQEYSRLLARLEDPEIDGASLKMQGDDGAVILVDGVGRMGYDITDKPEPWRRGYYETIMGCARAAEFLDSCVKDSKRTLAFPKAVVIGPSNPNPKPMPPGAPTAPREEDCVPAFDPPEKFYMKILTTTGFTEAQKVEAALKLGNWMDFKGTKDAAGEMYKWALDIATSSIDKTKVLDEKTCVIKPTAPPPSTNLLKTVTAIAEHKARSGDLSSALPIFLSLLRARRSLPDAPPPPPPAVSTGITESLVKGAVYWLFPPSFPSEPLDGTQPPQRDTKEKGEEAAIMAYVGEILYASAKDINGKEDGLAWTREAVDVAEQELNNARISEAARKVNKQVLSTGLGNWEAMVDRLAREEKERKAKGLAPDVPQQSGGWFSGLWGSGAPAQKQVREGERQLGRYELEKKVLQDRRIRDRPLLESQPTDVTSLFIFR